MVTITDDQGNSLDLTNKEDIERAIISNNEDKYKQSFHTPFLQPPLANDFGFKGLTPSAQQVLAGCYTPPVPIDPYVHDLILEWATPQPVRELGTQSMELSTPIYQRFWKKAKENISCYPDDLSFATMKAGVVIMPAAYLGCSSLDQTLKPLKSLYKVTQKTNQ